MHNFKEKSLGSGLRSFSPWSADLKAETRWRKSEGQQSCSCGGSWKEERKRIQLRGKMPLKGTPSDCHLPAAPSATAHQQVQPLITELLSPLQAPSEGCCVEIKPQYLSLWRAPQVYTVTVMAPLSSLIQFLSILHQPFHPCPFLQNLLHGSNHSLSFLMLFGSYLGGESSIWWIGSLHLFRALLGWIFRCGVLGSVGPGYRWALSCSLSSFFGWGQ